MVEVLLLYRIIFHFVFVSDVLFHERKSEVKCMTDSALEPIHFVLMSLSNVYTKPLFRWKALTTLRTKNLFIPLAFVP